VERAGINFNVIDKSIAQRAVVIGGLFFARRLKIDFGDGVIGEDIKSAIRCIDDIKAGKKKLYAGNSATAMRLIVGAAVGLGLEIEIDGDKSLNNRCMAGLINALKSMNAKVFGREGGDGRILPPIRVQKSEGLKGIEFFNEGLSAQLKSAVMLAGFNLDKRIKVVERIKTRDHTELMLDYFKEFGEHDNINLKIPYDVSSAAFLIVLALLKKGRGVRLDNVGINPSRMGFIEVLKKAGFDILIKDSGLFGLERVGSIYAKYSENTSLTPIIVEGDGAAAVIDEIVILCVAASFIEGESCFRGLGALRNKESDRVMGIYRMLKEFGVHVRMDGDDLKVVGSKFVKLKKKPVIQSKDHRIIMAAAVMGELLNGVDIVYPEYTKISYPNFFEDIKRI